MRASNRIAALAAMTTLPGVVQAAEQASSGGMPQLDFGNPWTIAQVVWMLIIFGLLYYVMAQYALPQVASVLDERRRTIDGDLEAAQASKAQADAAMAEHREATARARAEAQAAIAAASQQAQVEAAAKAEALNARLAQQIDAAEQRIGAARDAAMGALRQVANDTTAAVVSRLIGAADPAAIDRAVDRELTARAGGRA